jgi:hypothetical protein
MLLAARALGVGATLTRLYLNFEKQVEAALGRVAAGRPFVCPVADRHPMGRFGPVRRIALADVVFEDRWGKAFLG